MQKMASSKVEDQIFSVTLTNSSVKKAVKSYTMSKRYINTMLKTSVINILYHRLNIDEKEFITKNFKNIPFKCFRSKSKNTLIRQYHAYMTACREAIDKNYLKCFSLYLIDAESSDIIENYRFSFNYNEGNNKENVVGGDDLVDNTCEFLRTLEDLSKHDKQNLEIQIKVEFTYYDETPDDYEPPGFRRINEEDSLSKKIEGIRNYVTIGKLFTGFHRLKCTAKGGVYSLNIPMVVDEEEETPNNLETDINKVTSQDNNFFYTEDMSPAVIDCVPETENAPEPTQKNRCCNETYLSQIDDDLSDNDIEIIENICPCKLPDIQNFIFDKVQCGTCKQTFHAPCQGYLNKCFIDGSTIQCDSCRSEGGSESVINAIDSVKPMVYYRIRYILACVYNFSGIPQDLKVIFNETIDKLQKTGSVQLSENGNMRINNELVNMFFKFSGNNTPEYNRFEIKKK